MGLSLGFTFEQYHFHSRTLESMGNDISIMA